SAPGGAEQVHALEAQLGAEGIELLEEHRQAPLDVLRSVGATAAELVVEHDLPLVGETLEGREVVVGGAGTAVEAKQRLAAALAGDAIPGAPDRALDPPFHRESVSRTGRYNPPSCPLSSVGRAPPW